jgi:predicted CoA-binding protein
MSPEFKTAVHQFFDSQQIAVVGYSDKEESPGRLIYDKLKSEGYHVYAVNPTQPVMDEGWCYESLASINSNIDGIVICAPPDESFSIVKQAHALKVKTVWMHRSIDNGSYSKEAEEHCHELGITCISFGCPIMFLEPDFGHQCLKWFFNVKGRFGDVYVDKVDT